MALLLVADISHDTGNTGLPEPHFHPVLSPWAFIFRQLTLGEVCTLLSRLPHALPAESSPAQASAGEVTACVADSAAQVSASREGQPLTAGRGEVGALRSDWCPVGASES